MRDPIRSDAHEFHAERLDSWLFCRSTTGKTQPLGRAMLKVEEDGLLAEVVFEGSAAPLAGANGV